MRDILQTETQPTNASHSASDECGCGELFFSREVVLQNKRGLHARAAVKLATLAAKFNCQSLIGYVSDDDAAKAADLAAGARVDMRSVMGMMMLGAACGSRLRLCTKGQDALAALDGFEAIINDRFGEGE